MLHIHTHIHIADNRIAGLVHINRIYEPNSMASIFSLIAVFFFHSLRSPSFVFFIIHNQIAPNDAKQYNSYSWPIFIYTQYTYICDATWYTTQHVTLCAAFLFIVPQKQSVQRTFQRVTVRILRCSAPLRFVFHRICYCRFFCAYVLSSLLLLSFAAVICGLLRYNSTSLIITSI